MKGTKRLRKPPQRTCVSCGANLSKRELVRIVRADVGVDVDPTGRKNGRGAYLCRRAECWDKATKSDGLGRALRRTLTTDEIARLTQYANKL